MKQFIRIMLIALLSTQLYAGEGYLENSLNVGDKAKNFSLPNVNGKKVKLSDLLKDGPVILSFYRGGWCPVCNSQLREYQKHLSKFKKLGATLVAVSPETPTSAAQTMFNNQMQFLVLSDKSNKVAKKYGILWEIPKEAQDGFSSWLLKTQGKSLKEYNGKEGYLLPIPATFIINQEREIIYAFKDVNYKNRANIEEMLNLLEERS